MTEEAIEYVPKTTPDLTQQQIDRLKQIFPECVTEGAAGGGIDFDLLRATLGDADALAIEFNSSGIYEYHDVPLAVYQGLMNAPSNGKYFHRYIKGTPRSGRESTSDGRNIR